MLGIPISVHLNLVRICEFMWKIFTRRMDGQTNGWADKAPSVSVHKKLIRIKECIILAHNRYMTEKLEDMLCNSNSTEIHFLSIFFKSGNYERVSVDIDLAIKKRNNLAE